jgi:hypothetical protein
MRVGEFDAGGSTMMAEQGPQSRGGHAGSAGGAFQRDEERACAGIGPFQPQIVIQQLYGFRRPRQEAKFVPFTPNPELGFGEQHVVSI